MSASKHVYLCIYLSQLLVDAISLPWRQVQDLEQKIADMTLVKHMKSAAVNVQEAIVVGKSNEGSPDEDVENPIMADSTSSPVAAVAGSIRDKGTFISGEAGETQKEKNTPSSRKL